MALPLVQRPRAYALGEADALLAENPEYLALSDAPGRRQQLWRELLLGDDPREEAVRRRDWAIGDDAFRRQALMAQGRPAPRRRGRPRKTVAEGHGISPEGATNEGFALSVTIFRTGSGSGCAGACLG